MAVTHGKTRASYSISPTTVVAAKAPQKVTPYPSKPLEPPDRLGQAAKPTGAGPTKKMPVGKRFQKPGTKRGSQDMG